MNYAQSEKLSIFSIYQQIFPVFLNLLLIIHLYIMAFVFIIYKPNENYNKNWMLRET